MIAQGQALGPGAIPPGQRPPAGMCRVWINGVPPGRQPAATNCATAARNRPANARIIYGSPSTVYGVPGTVYPTNRSTVVYPSSTGYPGSVVYPSTSYPSTVYPGTVYPSTQYPSTVYPNGTVYPRGTAYPNGAVYPNGTILGQVAAPRSEECVQRTNRRGQVETVCHRRHHNEERVVPTTVYPNGGVAYPNASVVYPNSRVVYPNAGVMYPNSRVVYPNRTVIPNRVYQPRDRNVYESRKQYDKHDRGDHDRR